MNQKKGIDFDMIRFGAEAAIAGVYYSPWGSSRVTLVDELTPLSHLKTFDKPI